MNIPPEKGSQAYINELHRRMAIAQKEIYEIQKELDEINSSKNGQWNSTDCLGPEWINCAGG